MHESEGFSGEPEGFFRKANGFSWNSGQLHFYAWTFSRKILTVSRALVLQSFFFSAFQKLHLCISFALMCAMYAPVHPDWSSQGHRKPGFPGRPSKQGKRRRMRRREGRTHRLHPVHVLGSPKTKRGEGQNIFELWWNFVHIFHLPVTPVQLMRPGIGRNVSHIVGDFA